jgi:hypothetical protein
VACVSSRSVYHRLGIPVEGDGPIAKFICVPDFVNRPVPSAQILAPFVLGVEFFGVMFLLIGFLTRISAGAGSVSVDRWISPFTGQAERWGALPLPASTTKARWAARLGALCYIAWGLFHVNVAHDIYILGFAQNGITQGRLYQLAAYMLCIAMFAIAVAALPIGATPNSAIGWISA